MAAKSSSRSSVAALEICVYIQDDNNHDKEDKYNREKISSQLAACMTLLA